jgi:D-sedoheptulose 7-phosphate isomerase
MLRWLSQITARKIKEGRVDISSQSILEELIERFPSLAVCKAEIQQAFLLMKGCFQHKGKLLVCGNGGSAADAEHIVGELMKGFKLKRALPPDPKARLEAVNGEAGRYLAAHLQQALPAIALTGHPALATAFQNDVAGDLVFAQQVLGYGCPNDVVWGLSTSGNAKNVLYAAQVAKALEIHSIALTGEGGGKLAGVCDVTIRVPAVETYQVQELHLPVYHCLCAMLEMEFFG